MRGAYAASLLRARGSQLVGPWLGMPAGWGELDGRHLALKALYSILQLGALCIGVAGAGFVEMKLIYSPI